MGLFSSRSKTQVSTGVSRVIKDDLLPHAANTGVIKSIFNNGNISDYVMEELASSLALRADRMYEYAKNNYTYGLPSGQRVSSDIGKPEVTVVLSSITGSSVYVDYCHMNAPNALHIGWMTLVNNYGYSNLNNQLATLTTQKHTPVYLKDMVVVIPESQIDNYEPNALVQWGVSPLAGYTPERSLLNDAIASLIVPSPIYTDPTATREHVKVTYVWQATEFDKPVIKEDSFVIYTDDYQTNSEYFHAKYLVNGKAFYWMYLIGSGEYPTLDALLTTQHSEVGTYFPFIYFRFNKTLETADKTTEAYKTSKRAAKYIGMDYDQIAEAINDNPSIADVEQAMMIMAIPANTTDEMDRRYLFDFFNELYAEDSNQDTLSIQSLIRTSLAGSTGSSKSSIVIQDKRFKLGLTNEGIYKKIVSGSFGAIGTHDSGTTTSYQIKTVISSVDEREEQISVPVLTHYYRRQVTETLYEEIGVTGLKMVYYVYGEYTTTGDDTDTILMIPIDRSISSAYSSPDRETLYARSLHYVFNSRTVTEIKWYQSELFQVVLIIAAIVITVFSAFSDGGSAIGLALGFTGTTAILATIIVNLIIGQLLVKVFKLFVKVFGVDISTLLAIAAILYGGYQVIQAGSVAGAPWATELLQLSSGLNKAVIESKFDDLLSDSRSFSLYIEEQTKLLDKAQDLLDNTSMLSPFIIFGESPDDFYNRTVHSSNIGVLSIDAISHYADIAIALPKFNEIIGDTNNG